LWSLTGFFLKHNVENQIVVEIDSKIHMNLKHKYFEYVLCWIIDFKYLKLISEKNVIFYKVLVFLVPPENKFVKKKSRLIGVLTRA